MNLANKNISSNYQWNRPVDDPLKTIESFNRQFQLKEPERKAIEWAWPHEMGDTMFQYREYLYQSFTVSGVIC